MKPQLLAQRLGELPRPPVASRGLRLHLGRRAVEENLEVLLVRRAWPPTVRWQVAPWRPELDEPSLLLHCLRGFFFQPTFW